MAPKRKVEIYGDPTVPGGALNHLGYLDYGGYPTSVSAVSSSLTNVQVSTDPLTGVVTLAGPLDDNIGILNAFTQTAGAPNGLATLNAVSQVPLGQLPAGAPDGLATLDSSGRVPLQQLAAGDPNGLATLDASGRLTLSQLPEAAIAGYLGAVASEVAMLQLDGQIGDWCIRTDTLTNWFITGEPSSVIANWVEQTTPVVSVDGQTGSVVLTAIDNVSITGGPLNTSSVYIATSTSALTTASTNICMGPDTAVALTEGSSNVVLGAAAGSNMTTANANVLVGFGAGRELVSGYHNVILGEGAGVNYTGGESGNICINAAGVTGENNVARVGDNTTQKVVLAGVDISGQGGVYINTAAPNLTSGGDTVAIGVTAGQSMTSGLANVLVGYAAGQNITTGRYNVVVGAPGAINLTTGEKNICMGFGTGPGVSGTRNVLIGEYAGNAYTTSESNNVCIQSTGTIGDNGAIRVGDNTSTSCYIAGIATSFLTGEVVVAQVDGRLGTQGTLAASAFSDTTDANNIVAGTLDDAHLPVTMVGKTLTASTVNGVTLAGGGTLTVIGGGTLVTSAYLDTTNASNIVSGILNDARIPVVMAGKTMTTTSVNGVFLDGSGTLSVGSGGTLVPSAYTDTTNASNIGAGTLNDARLPVAMAGKTMTTTTVNGVNLIGSGPLNVGVGGNLVPSAFSDTTIASNIVAGTLADARLPLVMAGKTMTTSSVNGVTLAGSGTLAVGVGGTLAPSAYVDTTNASNIGAGTLVDARLPLSMAGKTLTTSSLNGVTTRVANSTSIGVGTSSVGATWTTGTNDTAVGFGALNSLTSGVQCTGIGSGALQAAVTSSNCTAVGFNAALLNTQNGTTAMGSQSLASNVSGVGNTAFGAFTGQLTTASANTFIGFEAGQNNTTGSNNTMLGYDAGKANSVGQDNTFVGQNCGLVVTGSRTTALGSACLQTMTSGENTGFGFEAGRNITTGTANVIAGRRSGRQMTTGNNNVVVGDEAFENALTASECVAIGQQALRAVTTSSGSVAIGCEACINTTAANITAVGYQALRSLTSGTGHTAVGQGTLESITTGTNCTAVGLNAGTLATGNNNVFVGTNAGAGTTTGSQNTIVGAGAGITNNTSGGINMTAIGFGALALHQGPAPGNAHCTAVGSVALANATTAIGCTAVGINAGNSVTTGGFNTFVGNRAGIPVTTGTNNVCVGYDAGISMGSTASNCTFINNAGVTGVNNEIRIGTPGGAGRCFMSYITGVDVSPGAVNVQVSAAGQLGVNISTRRAKEAIDYDFGNATSRLVQLQPARYYMKSWSEEEKKGTKQSGLIAEDVQEVYPEYVATMGLCAECDGEPLTTVNYQSFIVDLIKAVQELSARVSILEAQGGGAK